jgi:hypothetical protein
MSEDTVGVDVHKRVWGLLPWFVNGRLSKEESQTIEDHLSECVLCRRERDVQAKIHDAVRPNDAVAFASEASFRKLMADIDADEVRKRTHHGPPWMKWLVAAVVVESVALVGWGAWAFTGAGRAASPDARYVTVSDPTENTTTADVSRVRVVFASQATLGDMQSLLRSIQGHVIDGPTENGVYTIALDQSGGLEADRVSALRASAHVRFAELVHTIASPAP